MLTLSSLVWMLLVAALVSLWWNSDKVKSLALAAVTRHCRERGLQLLDQTLVLKGLWPVRDKQGQLKLRRRYLFEFTSTGEQRYSGEMLLLGLTVHELQLEAHIIPEEDDGPH